DGFSYQCKYVGGDAKKIACGSHATSDKESVSSASLVIVDKEFTGVSLVPSDNPYVDVYNSLGVLVRKHVLESEALKGLMPGVYVVGDKKMIKNDKE
ncbi:MAG: hypothetical protein IKZ67_00920, partial [Paludibacteraceae bacterium]|nr:hypothetical protein [Paludibacteraceae bacterium]